MLCLVVLLIACDQRPAELAPDSASTLPTVTPTPIALLPSARTSIHQTALPSTLHASTSIVLPTTTGATPDSVVMKRTSAAMMFLTETALPSVTATPTLPLAARACHATDLRATAGTNGAGGSISFGIQVTNTSASVCTLQGPPQIQLVNQRGQVLDSDYFVNCFRCSELISAYETALPATLIASAVTATSVGQTVLYGKIGIGPGERAGVFLLWQNWCQPFPKGGVRIRLTLAEQLGRLEVATDAYVGGRCDAADARSSVMISHFSHIP
jgi:hypothetical protein